MEARLKTSFEYQGWSPQVAQAFHYQTQGSELVPYYWFLKLREPNGVKVVDDLPSTGVLYDDPTVDNALLNPDHLPIGFVKQEENYTYKDSLGKDTISEHNTGHKYGWDLSVDDKLAIMECI